MTFQTVSSFGLLPTSHGLMSSRAHCSSAQFDSGFARSLRRGKSITRVFLYSLEALPTLDYWVQGVFVLFPPSGQKEGSKEGILILSSCTSQKLLVSPTPNPSAFTSKVKGYLPENIHLKVFSGLGKCAQGSQKCWTINSPERTLRQ